MAKKKRPSPSKNSKPKLSKLEQIKKESELLRGPILTELTEDVDHFSEQAKQLLKFHGSYQQDDRDLRKSRSKEGLSRYYYFMVRCRMPGGKFNARQYLAIDELCEKYGNSTIRLTSRQGIQLHGILKSDLQATIQGINECLMSTLGACGDVERNVMCCPAPLHSDEVRQQMQQHADAIANHLAPRSGAYHEIWLNGQAIGTNGKSKKREREPIYGKTYLPRKFKTGLSLPEDNCVDVYTQDLGLLAIVKNGKLLGYNVLCGGGSGRTHGNANTFPSLGRAMCFVPPEDVVAMAEAVVKVFRDHGNRADRKQARLKYLVNAWGVKKFRDVLKTYFKKPFKMPKRVKVTGFDLHLGWQPQGDGQWFYGLSVENGRIQDNGKFQLRTALRKIMSELQPELRLTPQQDILLCNLPKTAHARIRKILADHHLLEPKKISLVRQLSLACPAIPTCGLALSESERMLPDLLTELEGHLKKLGLSKQEISIRVTGCPNGCVRPYQSDVGIVGRSGDKYVLYLGGSVIGDRLNQEFQDLVPRDRIVPTLVTVLKHYKKHRHNGEGFGDYCHRVGVKKLAQELLASS